jgi:hypothetical protein
MIEWRRVMLKRVQLVTLKIVDFAEKVDGEIVELTPDQRRLRILVADRPGILLERPRDSGPYTDAHGHTIDVGVLDDIHQEFWDEYEARHTKR